MKVLILLALVAAALYIKERRSGIRAAKRSRERVEQLKAGENYGRLVRFNHKGKEYIASVAKWNIYDKPGYASLWCIEGPNPDGWTQFFSWKKEDLEFL
jgi:hypothetical protein